MPGQPQVVLLSLPYLIVVVVVVVVQMAIVVKVVRQISRTENVVVKVVRKGSAAVTATSNAPLTLSAAARHHCNSCDGYLEYP